MSRFTRPGAGDLWGGMAATAVVLPQAMAFGVALLAPVGIDPASGALAGLIGAASLSLCSGLSGGTQGLISAPTGPTLVLLVGVVTALSGGGLDTGGVLTGMAVVMVLTGIFQSLIGLSGGGRLIKYIPYPVVAGFMTGSAILMILSQLDPLSGEGYTAPWASWRWVVPLTAVFTYACMSLLPRWLPKVPGTIAGLFGGTLLFQFLAWMGPGEVPGAWVIGTLPGLDAVQLGMETAVVRELPLKTLLFSSLALAVLASLDTLLTSVIADVETGSRHDARRELAGQGAGQILSGLLGGMAGAGTTGATVISVRSGGRRYAGLFAGLTFALLVGLFGPVGGLVPICVLAGIILHVAVHMVEGDILAWLRRSRTRTDALIALLVTIVTVAYDLMAAVGLGVGIAVLLFVAEQVRAPVIHRRTTAAERHSVRVRPSEQYELLEQHGDEIVIYELRGSLFFATADKLFEQLSPDLDQCGWVILNFRRVSQVDLSALRILRQMADRLQAHGGMLLFTNVHKQMGMGRKVHKTLRKISPGRPVGNVRSFSDTDEALEFAEDALLERLGASLPAPEQALTLEQTELCREMTPEQTAALAGECRQLSLKQGESLFRVGDEGDALYVVTLGEVDILLPTGKHHHKRLAKCGPGSFFGEIALLEPGPRAASAVAVRDASLLELDRVSLERLVGSHPAAAVALLETLGRSLGEDLRWSARELHRLAQW